MNKSGFLILLVLALVSWTMPVWADHGTLLSNDRDPALNTDIQNLIKAGWIVAPAQPVNQLTNMQLVQLTAQAGNSVPLPPPSMDLGLPSVSSNPGLLPQPSAADLPFYSGSPGLPNPGAPLPNNVLTPGYALTPSDLIAGKSLQQLVDEFQHELKAMGANTAQIKDRIDALEHENETLADLQKLYLEQTGTDITGYSRGYLNEYRGFGYAPAYGPAVYNDAVFGDIDMKSVPVPSVLFNANIRLWRTIGLYSQDPIEKNGGTLFDLRWLSLGNYNPYVNVSAGDFLRSYTPLTLWNYNVPVYNFIEPTSYYRTRKDLEDMVSMDYGNDWRLRGFEFFSDPKFEKGSFVSSLDAQAMGGPIDEQNPFQFGSYYAGGEGAVRFFQDGLEFKATGLSLWDDSGTVNPAPVLYNPKSYQIGSISTKLVISFAKDINITGTAEGANSQYNNDLDIPANAPTTESELFNDGAFMGTTQLNIQGFHLQAKYLDVGSYFYSPGAQTNRWTPTATAPGYLSNDSYWEDEGTIGYLNNFPFQGIQGVGAPYYAPYDRMSENILPYGDATPNRRGLFGTLDWEIGHQGWLRPQASYVFQAQEIQPNWVYNSLGQEVAVDSNTTTATARTFSGYEMALTLDFAKAFDMTGQTYQLAFDYKNQVTNLGGGLTPFTVNSYIASLDFNPPVPGFDSLVLSCAYKYAQSTGDEYFLSGVSGLDETYTLASYSFLGESSNAGSYVLAAPNLTETSWAFGFMFPLSSTVEFHGDYFINQYNEYSSAQKAYVNSWDDIWRFSYEAHF